MVSELWELNLSSSTATQSLGLILLLIGGLCFKKPYLVVAVMVFGTRVLKLGRTGTCGLREAKFQMKSTRLTHGFTIQACYEDLYPSFKIVLRFM